MKRYNHLYTLAISVETDTANPFEVPASKIRAALADTIKDRDRAGDWADAFALVDTVDQGEA